VLHKGQPEQAKNPEGFFMVENREKLLSDGLLIAGVPLLGYAIAFAYEYGYARYYGIPWQLISVSLTQVLGAIAGLFWILLFLSVISAVWYDLFSSEKARHPAIAALWRLSPVFFLFLVYLFVYGAKWTYLGAALVMVVFFSIWEFLLPLLGKRDKTTYGERLLAEQNDQFVSTLLNLAVRKYGTVSLKLFSYGTDILLLVFLASLAGHGEAVSEKSYFTDSVNRNVVILRFYSDTVVAHEYDPNTHKLTGDLILTKISSKQQLRFEKKPLGHLEKPSP
jgi:hypothetical protein